ncbi:MAG TPA: 30S ribosomal protein S12 methylthiotransferase RimO [Coriobacteriia bacterium]|nr:30S ribosomal protein S12 methylthiotransferase RimO [Coriobacteriia bacterium]
MSNPPAIAFMTLGCPKNEVDTDRMRAAVSASAFRVTDDADQADVIVLNTCGFITDAVEESVSVALDLADWRDERPGRRLVVAGCMVSRYRDALADAMPEADAFVPLADEPHILGVIERLTGHAPQAFAGPARTGGSVSEYLQISDGCFRSCAYCTIPAIRGPYRSRPFDELTEEARLLVSHGARELVLIGQDTTSWGRDLPEAIGVTGLVRAIASTQGLAWLRLMYVQPDTVTPELIETIAEVPQVRHYLDIPLQHASPRVLKAMRRTGSGEAFLALIERIRSAVPAMVLRTTFIAGYPGETEKDVDDLAEFIAEADLDYVAVLPFSAEEGTEAAGLPGQLPEEEKAERANHIRELADGIAAARAMRHVGEVLDVLSLGSDPEGQPVGRWSGQAPDVDGYVMLDRDVEPGRIVPVRISASYGVDLEGEVVT